MAVPNTTTFTLQDVITEIYGAPTAGLDLADAFIDGPTSYFNATYKAQYYAEAGNRNNLLMFRDYGVHNSTVLTAAPNSFTWLSFELTAKISYLTIVPDTVFFTEITGDTSRFNVVSDQSLNRITINPVGQNLTFDDWFINIRVFIPGYPDANIYAVQYSDF